MRALVFALAACSAVAFGAASQAAIDSYMTFKPSSDADAMTKCGPKPNSPGDWSCVGKGAQPMADPKLSGPKTDPANDPKITWTWVKGGAPAADPHTGLGHGW